MAGKGGGAWKVAYADFVTAMIAFFLVMWITAQSKPVKQAVAEYFEDPLGTNSGSRSTAIRGPEDATTVGNFQSGRGPGRSLAMANLKSKAIQNPAGVSAVKPPRVLIARNDETTRSTGITVAFGAGSALLDDAGRTRLDQVIPVLLGKPNVVEIRGSLERRPSAAQADPAEDWQLSYARCAAVRTYLAESGIRPERIRLSQTGAFESVAARSEGSGGPKAPPGSFVEVFALSEYARGPETKYEEQNLDARPRPTEDSGHGSDAAGHGDEEHHEEPH